MDFGLWTLLAALLLLLLAIGTLALSARARRLHGLPGGAVVYSDTGVSEVEARPLYSPRYGIAGKPDYLVATRQGLVPVELKPTRTDPEPQESHLLQVLAYCLLVEDAEGKPPPYGLLRYQSETFKVDYNDETRTCIIGVIDEMREAGKQAEVHRNHDQPGRCRACGYKDVCEESLISPKSKVQSPKSE
jgi:CRISPR-associated exonuclease Cas4